MKIVYVINQMEYISEYKDDVCVEEFKFLCQKECHDFYSKIDTSDNKYYYTLTFYWIGDSETIESAELREQSEFDAMLESLNISLKSH